MRGTQSNSNSVYLGIGSNIDPEKHVPLAIRLLTDAFGELAMSRIYTNPAHGFAGDDFQNLVVCFDYEESIEALLTILARIEYQCGRRRDNERGMGARTLDLDLLLFGELQGSFDGISLPRADVYERDFVQIPLMWLLDEMEVLSEFEHRLLRGLKETLGTVS